MLDHLSLQVADVGSSAASCTGVFAGLGVREAMRYGGPDGDVVGLCGPSGYPAPWLGPLVDRGHRPVHHTRELSCCGKQVATARTPG